MTREPPHAPAELPGYETDSAWVHLRPDGVMHAVVKPVTLTSEHVQTNLHHRLELLRQGPAPIVLDVRQAVGLVGEARRHYASPASVATCCALAIVANPGLNRLIGNLLAAAVATSGRTFPIEFFTDEGAALAWAARNVTR